MATAADPVQLDSDGQVQFSTYEKMATDSNGWVSGLISTKSQKWVALEKVHGANLSFTVQRVDKEVVVKIARRNAYLDDGENFFGIYQQASFVDELVTKIRQLYEEACKVVEGSIQALVVYGELFGGTYPHPDVPAVSKMKPVQQEVLYCPGLQFMAFDIAVVRPMTSDEDDNKSYLDYDVCMQLFKSCGLFYAEPLQTGSFADMMNFELGFDSTIPASMGLPPFSDGKKNPAEGIVIKPVKNLVLMTKNGLARVIIKRKIDGFRETRPRVKKPRPKLVDEEYNPDYELVKSELLAMVTRQRLVNVISKTGLPDAATSDKSELRDKWRKISQDFVADIVEDMGIEHAEVWRNFKREHGQLMGRVMGALKKECAMTVGAYRGEQGP